MPYAFEKKHIPRKYDKRVKLTSEDKEEIHYRYNVLGGVSQRALAADYGVSRRLITFIINPDTQKENLKRRKERGVPPMDTKTRNEYMRKHRAYKRELDKKGLLE